MERVCREVYHSTTFYPQFDKSHQNIGCWCVLQPFNRIIMFLIFPDIAFPHSSCLTPEYRLLWHFAPAEGTCDRGQVSLQEAR